MLFALCLPAEAQQPGKVFRIGYLSAVDPATDSPRREGIRLALRELGYIEGQNVAFEYRYGRAKGNANLSSRQSWYVSKLILSW
jgi:putative tryptophan/tyrosine transport system substrate-binding protein